jgi:hypothetical protein
MKKISILFCITVVLVINSGCVQKPETLKGVVTFVYGYLTLNGHYATVGDRISKDDILETVTNSLAVIQISQTSVITLHSETKLKFNNLMINKDKSHTIELFLDKGHIYNKLIKKGTDYSVKSRTIISSARGTSYEVIADKDRSRISLLSGKLHIEKIEDKIKQVVTTLETELVSGQFIETDARGIGQSVTLEKAEIDILSEFDSIYFIDDVERKVPQLEVIPVNVEPKILGDEKNGNTGFSSKKKDDFKPDSAAVKSLIKKEKRTIEEIKGVFGKTDEIVLFSGRIIRGAIMERGEKYSILTTDGLLNISAKEIQSVRVVR